MACLSPLPLISKLCFQTFAAGRVVRNHLSAQPPRTPLISMWMREQNISDLLRVTSKAVWSHTFPFSDFRVYSFLFHLQSTFNSFLEQSCSFLLGKLLAESVFASETDSLFIQTNRMFFIPIHSWALPLTLPALLPCPGGRGDGKAGPGERAGARTE